MTGYYGEATENAVRNFQSRNGLTSDGLVGVQTMAKLTSDNVRRPAANSSGSGTTTRPGQFRKQRQYREITAVQGNTGKPSGNTTPPVSIPASGGASALYRLPHPNSGHRIWGAKGPNSFDCSGFIYWCLNQVGVNQSYLTSSGWRNVGPLHEDYKL